MFFRKVAHFEEAIVEAVRHPVCHRPLLLVGGLRDLRSANKVLVFHRAGYTSAPVVAVVAVVGVGVAAAVVVVDLAVVAVEAPKIVGLWELDSRAEGQGNNDQYRYTHPLRRPKAH